jgi:hypothetical protein
MGRTEGVVDTDAEIWLGCSGTLWTEDIVL